MFDRVKSGIGIGLIFASFYSLYVIVLYVFQGQEPFARLGTNLMTVIATYFFGGITAGAVVGILQPLNRWRLGGILIGIVAAFFVFFGIAVAADGPPTKWERRTWEPLLALPILFGTFAGIWFRKRPIR